MALRKLLTVLVASAALASPVSARLFLPDDHLLLHRVDGGAQILRYDVQNDQLSEIGPHFVDQIGHAARLDPNFDILLVLLPDLPVLPSLVRIDGETGDATTVTAGGLLDLPGGIAVGQDGLIYITDFRAGLIRVDPATGAQEVVLAGNQAYVSAAPDGTLAILASSGIYRFDPATGEHRRVSDHFGDHDIVVSPGNRIYITDPVADRILRLDEETGTTEVVSQDGLLNLKTRASFDRLGDLIAFGFAVRVNTEDGSQTYIGPDNTSAIGFDVVPFWESENPCSDGWDNDADGLADHPQDRGCTSPEDLSEREPGFDCDDGVDNDGDTFIDLADPGCRDPLDPDELGRACDNGLDDDIDGLVDLADPGCDSLADFWETSDALPCDNGLDDDGDFYFDQWDPACIHPGFPSESTACDDGVDNDGDGGIDWDGDDYRNMPDLECQNAAWKNSEEPVRCGMGAGLASVLWLGLKLRQRRFTA